MPKNKDTARLIEGRGGSTYGFVTEMLLNRASEQPQPLRGVLQALQADDRIDTITVRAGEEEYILRRVR